MSAQGRPKRELLRSASRAEGVPASTLAFIGLGSNLAHPRRRIARALAAIAHLPGTRLLRASPNYASAPLGASVPQPDFVNAVALVSTRLRARDLLGRLLAIERRHRRVRVAGVRNGPRTLDLDLLLFGRLRMATRDLALPHPRMHERAFVLKPLADLAPHARVPGRGVAESLARRVTGQRIARTRRHAR